MATALGRLNPTAMIDNPVVFALELLAVAATLLAIIRLASASAADASFAAVAGAGLWALVFLAVFGKAFGGGRRAARLDALRATRQQTVAKRLSASGVGDRRRYELVASDLLVPGDLVLVEANRTHPHRRCGGCGCGFRRQVSDNRRVSPVIRDNSEERAAVVGGTDVISDWLVIKVTAAPGAGFFETIVALVEQAQHPRPTMGGMITIGAICATTWFPRRWLLSTLRRRPEPLLAWRSCSSHSWARCFRQRRWCLFRLSERAESTNCSAPTSSRNPLLLRVIGCLPCTDGGDGRAAGVR